MCIKSSIYKQKNGVSYFKIKNKYIYVDYHIITEAYEPRN